MTKNLRRFYPIDTKITQDDLWLIRIWDNEGRHQRPTGSAIKILKTRNVAYLRSGVRDVVENSKAIGNVRNGHIYIDVMKQHIP